MSRMSGSGLPAYSVDYRKFTVDMISEPTASKIVKLRARLDQIAAIPDNTMTCRNVIGALADVYADLSTFEGYMAELPANAAIDKSIRDAGNAAQKDLDKLHIEMSMRKDIFDKIVALEAKTDWDLEHAQTRRYVDRLIKQGRRKGLHMDQETRDKLQSLRNRISEVSIEFSRNCSEDTTTVLFSEAELDGLPETFLQSLEREEDGRCKINLLAPHSIVMRLCKNSETRRRLAEARNSKCQQSNTPLLHELIQLYFDQAQLLGYQSNAHYKTELNMARSPQTVHDFLAQLLPPLKKLWAEERRQFEALKREELQGQSDISEDQLQIKMWDVLYYSTLVTKRHYAVDHEKLREYFPLQHVQDGMFAIYQRLLGLRFSLVPDAEVWHDEVRLYRVQEAAESPDQQESVADDPDSGVTLGYFYLDLFPRDGKYDHFCVASLRAGRQLPSDVEMKSGGEDQPTEYEVPVCVMLANFPRATSEQPSLLDHSNVTTFFHEFGHAMHFVCSRAKYSGLMGMYVEDDFVEAPSQMLENWTWHPETLAMMSAHYKDDRPIPDELMQALVRSRQANTGISNLRQMVYATFDQEIFGTGAGERGLDTAAIFSRIYHEMCDLDTVAGTNTAASFGHMASGYDANYYGYLWSEVFSCDMFASGFGKEGVLSAEMGRRYRRCVLEPGATRDAFDLLRDFLGREPNNEAFLKMKGIDSPSS